MLRALTERVSKHARHRSSLLLSPFCVRPSSAGEPDCLMHTYGRRSGSSQVKPGQNEGRRGDSTFAGAAFSPDSPARKRGESRGPKDSIGYPLFKPEPAPGESRRAGPGPPLFARVTVTHCKRVRRFRSGSRRRAPYSPSRRPSAPAVPPSNAVRPALHQPIRPRPILRVRLNSERGRASDGRSQRRLRPRPEAAHTRMGIGSGRLQNNIDCPLQGPYWDYCP
jgi:hypothetical protein